LFVTAVVSALTLSVRMTSRFPERVEKPSRKSAKCEKPSVGRKRRRVRKISNT
jgi:hypothetical protein